MKASNKSSIITGVVLLLLAALFSISLLLQPLDFGVGGPGHNNFFFLIGNILYTVYGFSSILIPVFLLVAGLSCFATKWTARKTMYLLTALVPFFTSVITENICRSILALGKSNFTPIKIAVTLITGIMLIVIEFLGAGILADKINRGDFNKNKKPEAKKSENDEIDVDGDSSQTDVEETPAPESKDVFDEALAEVEPKTVATEVADDNGSDGEEVAAEETENQAETEVGDASEVLEEPETLETVNESVEKAAEDEGDGSQDNPVSIITQEEYAALTVQESEPEAEENLEDELEWPDLPPQPETLPPEYDENFDENDPALEFPPKDEDDIEDEPIEEKSLLDEFVAESEEEENPFSDFDIAIDDDDSDLEIQEESIDVASFEDEPENQVLGSDIQFEEETEESAYEKDVEEEVSKETPVAEKDDPYASTRYIDSVVENPAFPHGITIHEESEESVEETEEKKNPEIAKPKFPTRISLDDDIEQEIQAYEEAEGEDDDFSVFDIETPAVQTLKIPEVPERETPAIADNKTEQTETALATPTPAEEHPAQEEITAPAPTESDFSEFMDIDMNDDEAMDKLQESDFDFEHNEENRIFNQIAEQENEPESISSSVSDVFSDMEADIRRKNGLPEKGSVKPAVHLPEPEKKDEFEISDNDFIEDFEEESPAENPVEPNTATNLTKDELTDFFNAQTKENTPVTKEIEANPPKTNRATKKGPYLIPSSLLTAYEGDEYWVIDDATKEAAMNLKQTLAEFSIEAKIIGIKKGPVVTMFEILPAPGVRLSRIVALQDNIALSLAAQSIRIVAPIPGKQAVGIEVPNRNRSIVGFREIIEMDLPEWQKMAVPVILGKDILGKAQLIDLVKTPHMLIAGATGSGKSVCVNSLILSILYKRSFRDVKLILVDPKVVELKLYNNIPHLLTPVITEPKKALQALQYCLCEMERRYALLDSMGVRDISTYNQRIKERDIATEKLPYIVVIIDEFADLMATSGKELESIVARLTAMSRAVGIHLVLATQRPSVNVITGLIKANIPTRIAFMVASRTDSNIIIDSVGAEKLLGRGDMLFASAVDPAPVRIQGTFVNDNEVEDVVNAVKEYGEPDYIDDEIFVEDDDDVENLDLFGNQISDEDPLYDQALEIVVQAGKASASYIQRRLKIGYNRAARLVEEMEERGIVGPANGSKPREIIHIP